MLPVTVATVFATLWLSTLTLVVLVDAQWTQLWSDTASRNQLQPQPRAGHAMVQLNGSRYVFGGGASVRDGVNPYTEFDDTWRFDLESKAWTKIIADNAMKPAKRVHHVSALWSHAGGHEMVVFGGVSFAAATTIHYDPTLSPNMQPTEYNDVWRLSLPRDGSAGTEQWTKDPGMANVASPPPLSQATAVVHNDKLIVFGGIIHDKSDTKGTRRPTDFNDLWSYDLSACTWTQLTPVDAERPDKRFSHAMATLTDPATGSDFLLVWGGRNVAKYSGLSTHSDMWLFSMSQRKWVPLEKEEKLFGRYDSTLVALPGATRFWLFGGFQKYAKTDSVYDETRSAIVSFPSSSDLSDLETRSFEALSPIETTEPSARHLHRAVVWNDAMVIYGGMYDTRFTPATYYAEVWMFNLATAVLEDDHNPAMDAIALGGLAGALVAVGIIYKLCRAYCCTADKQAKVVVAPPDDTKATPGVHSKNGGLIAKVASKP